VGESRSQAHSRTAGGHPRLQPSHNNNARGSQAPGGRQQLSVFNRLPTEGYTQGGRLWVRERRDQELEDTRNTKLRQVRAASCVIPYVL
jgi:hypothetical protein